MIDKRRMRELAEQYDIYIDETVCEKLNVYAKMLCERNKSVNLTAITEPEEIMVKHFLDSLTAVPVIKQCSFEAPYKAIDVGTGAGFPGIVIAAADANCTITLLDSSNKRVEFLQEVCESLSINAQCIHMRAEDAARITDMRESYDIVLSRAVASMNVLAEYCMPFARVGGCFIAHKGKNAEQEIQQAENAIALTGGCFEKKYELKLPDESSRVLCVYRKTAATAEKYPRKPAKIGKQPL